MHYHEGARWMAEFALGMLVFAALMFAIWLLAHRWGD